MRCSKCGYEPEEHGLHWMIEQSRNFGSAQDRRSAYADASPDDYAWVKINPICGDKPPVRPVDPYEEAKNRPIPHGMVYEGDPMTPEREKTWVKIARYLTRME